MLPCCSKMEAFLLRVLFLMCCILLVKSLVCYNCWGVSQLYHCSRTMTCSGSELCFIERYLSENHEVFYSSGCAINQACTHERPFDGILEWMSFCNTEKCNKKPCVDLSSKDKWNCKEYKKAGLLSGVYTLDLRDGLPPFQVYCDMDTAGGGWTVFQRRKDGSVDFYRGWEDYVEGFGNLRGEFWLGNDHLHRLTKAGLTTLRVDLGDWEGNTRYAQYDSFQVGPASGYYRLSVADYSGTAGDSLEYHNRMAFSTKDAEHDAGPVHCAEVFRGAWWYNACQFSDLNGPYQVGGNAPKYGVGVIWDSWKMMFYSLKSSEMKLREP